MEKCMTKKKHIMLIRKVDDARGVLNVEKREWFVAIINNCLNNKYAKTLHNVSVFDSFFWLCFCAN